MLLLPTTTSTYDPVHIENLKKGEKKVSLFLFGWDRVVVCISVYLYVSAKAIIVHIYGNERQNFIENFMNVQLPAYHIHMVPSIITNSVSYPTTGLLLQWFASIHTHRYTRTTRTNIIYTFYYFVLLSILQMLL